MQAVVNQEAAPLEIEQVIPEHVIVLRKVVDEDGNVEDRHVLVLVIGAHQNAAANAQNVSKNVSRDEKREVEGKRPELGFQRDTRIDLADICAERVEENEQGEDELQNQEHWH